MAEAALFVFVVVVASAAFFFVGIVAFRSVRAAAFEAVVLLGFEIAAVFGAGLAAAFDGVLVRVLAGVGFDATSLRWAVRLTEKSALLTVALLVALLVAVWDTAAFDALLAAALPAVAPVVSTFGVAGRGFAAAALLAAGRPCAAVFLPVALARFTDAVGCAAVRAAALDAPTGLAVRGEEFGVLFASALAEEDFRVSGLAVALVGVALAAADVATAGLRTTAAVGLRSRATCLVLGDMCATPEIDAGRKRDRCDVPRGHQGTS